MNNKYFILYFISILSFVGCTKCEDCGDFYHEPYIKVIFLNKSKLLKDSMRVNITSFNGYNAPIGPNKDSTMINRKRAKYFFPVRMDTVNQSTFYKITYYNIKSPDTVRQDSFSLNYSLEEYFNNDKLLFRAYDLSIDPFEGTKDSLSCTKCFQNTATIYIYE